MTEEVKEKKRKRNQGPGNKYLAKLNEGFEKSKAAQILRLLSDQEELNKRFHECALIEEDEDIKDDDVDDSDEGGVDKENDDSVSDVSIIETERKIAQRLAQRKHKSVARCKTSMGFYDDEITEVPYSTERLELRESDSPDATYRETSRINTRINRPDSSNPRRRRYQLRQSMQPQSGELNDIPVAERRRQRPKTSYGERGRRFIRPPVVDSDSDSDDINDSFKDRQNSRSAPLAPRGRVMGFCETPTLSHPRDGVPIAQQKVAPIPQTNGRIHPMSLRHKGILKPATPDCSSLTPRTEPESSRDIGSSRPSDQQTRPTSSSAARQMISVDISPLNNNTITKEISNSTINQRPVQSRQGLKGSKIENYKMPQRRQKNLRQFENRVPPVTVMKLPPLDPSVGKPVTAAQRLLSVGKDPYL